MLLTISSLSVWAAKAWNLPKSLKQPREAKIMKPLLKVKGFEQYTWWNIHVYVCVHVYICKYVCTCFYRDLESGCAWHASCNANDLRIRAGVVLDLKLFRFLFQSLSLLSFPLLSSQLDLFLSLSLLFSFISSSLLFTSVLWRVLCMCVAVCRCFVCACLCVSLCHVSGV